jgi:hypothetical protein
MQNPIVAQTQKGFSIREQLTVIAGLSFVAAILLMSKTELLGSADGDKDGLNARAIVSTFNAAREAGNQTNYATKEEAIAAIIKGTYGEGRFSTSFFQLPLNAAGIPAVSPLITGFPNASTSSLLEYKDSRNRSSRWIPSGRFPRS